MSPEEKAAFESGKAPKLKKQEFAWRRMCLRALGMLEAVLNMARFTRTCPSITIKLAASPDPEKCHHPPECLRHGTNGTSEYTHCTACKVRIAFRTKTPEEIAENELDINALLGLNNHTMPINDFPDPFVSCCFVTDTLIFVNLFENAKLLHHHFFYDTEKREMLGEPVQYKF